MEPKFSETKTSNLWNWMNLNCLPNGIKLYCDTVLRGERVWKGWIWMLQYCRGNRMFHPGNTAVSIQWGSMGSERLKCQLKRRLNKGCVGGRLYSVCAHEVEYCLKFPPPHIHTHSYKPSSLDIPNHHEIACLPCLQTVIWHTQKVSNLNFVKCRRAWTKALKTHLESGNGRGGYCS